MKKSLLITLLAFLFYHVNSQDNDKIIKSIFDNALTDNTAYKSLEYLCKNTKGRLPGSAAAAEAVEFTRQALIKAGADTVWLQKVPVPHWERGYEECKIISSILGISELSISALGFSEGTGEDGLTAGVIEVKDFEDLIKLGKQKIEGKIVFFNRPADNTLVNTFAAYSGSVNQRTLGASEASKYGAAAVVVRSATQALDDFPHTGVTRFAENVKKIPAVAVSTLDADMLSRWLKLDPSAKIRLISTCKSFPDTWSYNVIGEIKGSDKPKEFIIAGGHLDAWDIAEGAHDDAGGCVQAIEMIRLFKSLNIKPKRSVRAVMFMNEEMSGTGGRTYASEAASRGEVQYAALESDRGVMSPRGFSFDTDSLRLKKLQSLNVMFAPFNIRDFEKGGGGSDINPLKASGTLLIGYLPDAQRYFYYHHSANDTFDKVNFRELQMGSAAIASLVYLIDLLDL